MAASNAPAELEILAGSGALIASALASAWLCIRALRRGCGTPGFMRSLVVGLLLVAAGAAWAIVDAVEPHLGRDLHDTFFLAAAISVAVGTARHPDLGPGPRRARYLVDAVIAGLSWSALVWLAASHSSSVEAIPPLREGAVIATSALVFAVTRTGIAITLHREKGSVAEAAAAIGAIAFGLCTLGGTLHLLADTQRPSPVAVGIGYGVLVIGILSFGVAAVVAERPQWRGPKLRRRLLHSLFDAMPVAVAVFATAALLADAATRGAFDRTAAVLLTVVVSSVLVRQSWTLADNRALGSSLRRTVEDLEHQATHDSLTGLSNRGGLHAQVDRAVGDSASTGDTCAVCFVDIDHLKVINDTLGHRAGDELIRETAVRLAELFGDAVTRFGGDEFVVTVVLSDASGDALAGQIVSRLSEPLEIDGHRVHPSCSVGIVVVDTVVASEELLRRADVALYQAKALGRNCAALYRPELDTGLMADLDLGPELRRAIDRDEFTLVYQPIVDLQTRRTAKVEALLRWQHPDRGLLAPDLFLEQAVSAGLLGAIGELSLRRACTDIATLADAVGPGQPSVSVNLSSSELADRRAVDRVRAALELAQVSPESLVVEITEDVIVDDAVQEVITEIRDLGVGLAVDDFGTGNSSLRQLGSYSADVLKIDRSFVEFIADDQRARAITGAVVALAVDLGLDAVAEGVEDEAQAQLLARMGCGFGQGWHFARPMPFPELLRRCVDEAATAYDRRASAVSASAMTRSSSSATDGRSAMAPTT